MKELRMMFVTIFIVLFCVVLYMLSPVVTPFFVAALLAYLGDPVVDRLTALGMRRTFAVSLVFVVLISALVILFLLLIPLMYNQVMNLIENVPHYFATIQNDWLPRLQHILHLPDLNLDSLNKTLLKEINSIASFAGQILNNIKKPANALMQWTMNIILIPVVTFYLLRDWNLLIHKIYELIPRNYAPTVVKLMKEADEVLGGFLRGQFLVMMALSLMYSSGLALIGLDMGIVIGMVSGMLSFVPYLGLLIGVVVASVMALLQFHDILHLFSVWAVFSVSQMLESMYLTPRLVGNRIGLHPVAVLFAVLAGGQLFGFMGVLLGLPTAAVLNVIVIYFKNKYLQSNLYDAERPIANQMRFPFMENTDEFFLMEQQEKKANS